MTSLRAGRSEAATGLAGVDLDPPERVADAILDLVAPVAAGRPVPAAYGGTRT